MNFVVIASTEKIQGRNDAVLIELQEPLK